MFKEYTTSHFRNAIGSSVVRGKELKLHNCTESCESQHQILGLYIFIGLEPPGHCVRGNGAGDVTS